MVLAISFVHVLLEEEIPLKMSDRRIWRDCENQNIDGSVCAFLSVQSGGSEQERTKKKRRGDRYSVQTSLIVAALKKMLPIGLNMCSPADQELINLAKIRYSLVLVMPRFHVYLFFFLRIPKF